MWTAIITALGAILPGVLKLFGGGDENARQARELGRAEQQNADMKEDVATIKVANVAAKRAEQGVENDPNDRDNRG